MAAISGALRRGADGERTSGDHNGRVQTLTSSAAPGFSAALASNGTELLHVWMYADKLLLHAQRYSLDGTALSGVFDFGPSTRHPIEGRIWSIARSSA